MSTTRLHLNPKPAIPADAASPLDPAPPPALDAAAEPFRAGDVVALQTEGPAMTVESHTADGVNVLWFNGATLCAATIAPGCLRRRR